MKRYIFLLLISCLVFTSCTQNKIKEIDLNTAKSIALQKYPDCEIVSIVHSTYGMFPRYIISLSNEHDLYVVDVDSIDGILTQQSHHSIDESYANVSISVAKAKQLALDYHNGELVDFYLTEINHMPYYSVNINDGTYLYSLTVDALTGETKEIEHHIIEY